MTLRTAVIPFLLMLLLGGAVTAQEGAPAADAAASQKPMETIADVPSKGRLALVRPDGNLRFGPYPLPEPQLQRLARRVAGLLGVEPK